MDLYKNANRHFRTQMMNDLRQMSTAELIISSEAEIPIFAWSALTILAERGLPVDGTYEQWVSACHPYLAAPIA